MVGKLIRCRVDPESRARFSIAQAAWQATALCDGFIGQSGGWDAALNDAIIFALWESDAALTRFMQEQHDPMLANNRQHETYLSCDVAKYSRLQMIPPFDDVSIQAAGFLRLAECHLIPGKRDAFVETQQRIWNPGMAACEGMLGGNLWQASDDPARCLITTYWESPECHAGYAETVFPELARRAGVARCVTELLIYQVRIEPDWTIVHR